MKASDSRQVRDAMKRICNKAADRVKKATGGKAELWCVERREWHGGSKANTSWAVTIGLVGTSRNCWQGSSKWLTRAVSKAIAEFKTNYRPVLDTDLKLVRGA